MTTQYTVVQYVPDATADERINIGLIAWDEYVVCSDFVKNWSRAEEFGGKEVSFLKEFAEEVSARTENLDISAYGEISPDNICHLINSWTDGIQFAQPRGSTKSARDLMPELSSMFLREGGNFAEGHEVQPVVRASHGKTEAIRKAYYCLKNAARRQMPERSKELVRKNQTLQGRFGSHVFDVVLANGVAFGAVNALSFSLVNLGLLQREVDATAWRIDDLRRNQKTQNMPVAVYAIPPTHESDAYARYIQAKNTFQGLDTKFIVKDAEMIKWAEGCLDAHRKELLESY